MALGKDNWEEPMTPKHIAAFAGIWVCVACIAAGQAQQAPDARVAGDGSDLRLTKMLKHGELVRAESVAAIVEMVRSSQVDAYAGPRVVLLKLSEQAPGSRVLDDGFGDIDYVTMVPKGKAGRIAYVSDFMEEAKSSGLVQRTIDQYGLKGIQVTGAKTSNGK
jgi:polar amino acid transport system substrate-binding protein